MVDRLSQSKAKSSVGASQMESKTVFHEQDGNHSSTASNQDNSPDNRDDLKNVSNYLLAHIN
jgi:hypothetical protein